MPARGSATPASWAPQRASRSRSDSKEFVLEFLRPRHPDGTSGKGQQPMCTTMDESRGVDWNVLTSHWLDVMDLDARPETRSPLEALARSSEIRCINAANPLDLFAAHRFLLTLLYWKADTGGGVERLRRSLLSGNLPAAVLSAIESEAESFRLFDAASPFLQDLEAQERKSAGSFFAEFACGTNIAHFHHGDNAGTRLCLRCATVGMLRLVPWSQAGGRGLSASVHNAPPIMALACGCNLAVTLGLNLVPLQGEAGQPKWSGQFAPTNRTAEIAYMEAFTWNPRRVRLLLAEEEGTCWRCGRSGMPLIGQIVYQKNDNTKSNKDGPKTAPFAWHDPSAFYGSAKPYVTVKSYNERLAASERDLAALIDQKGSAVGSLVLSANPDHQGWRLVIPCTNPANNKTFDHREIESPSLSVDAIRSLLPPDTPPARQQGMDGWNEPPAFRKHPGACVFVQSAVRLLTDIDWAQLAAAAYRQMHDSPAAFDLLSGLLWPLRDRKVPGLPSRNVAWLMLKLMAAVPSHARLIRKDARFCPLRSIPQRQLDERGATGPVRSPYPVSLPWGQRLEAALREALACHLRLRIPDPIDWPGLCHRLDCLLE